MIATNQFSLFSITVIHNEYLEIGLNKPMFPSVVYVVNFFTNSG